MRFTVKNNIYLVVADDEDHDGAFVEIYINDKFLALVTNRKNSNDITVEFPISGLDESTITREAKYEDLLEALDLAVKKLQCNPDSLPVRMQEVQEE